MTSVIEMAQSIASEGGESRQIGKLANLSSDSHAERDYLRLVRKDSRAVVKGKFSKSLGLGNFSKRVFAPRSPLRKSEGSHP